MPRHVGTGRKQSRRLASTDRVRRTQPKAPRPAGYIQDLLGVLFSVTNRLSIAKTVTARTMVRSTVTLPATVDLPRRRRLNDSVFNRSDVELALGPGVPADPGVLLADVL